MCSMHRFHYKMQPEHLNSAIDLLPKKEKELAKQCSQICLGASATTALINIRSKLGLKMTWTDEQIRHFTKKEQSDKLNLSEDAMTTENLITSFASRDDVNYLYVTYHPDQGMIMMTGTNFVVKCVVSFILVLYVLLLTILFLSFS